MRRLRVMVNHFLLFPDWPKPLQPPATPRRCSPSRFAPDQDTVAAIPASSRHVAGPGPDPPCHTSASDLPIIINYYGCGMVRGRRAAGRKGGKPPGRLRLVLSRRARRDSPRDVARIADRHAHVGGKRSVWAHGFRRAEHRLLVSEPVAFLLGNHHGKPVPVQALGGGRSDADALALISRCEPGRSWRRLTPCSVPVRSSPPAR